MTKQQTQTTGKNHQPTLPITATVTLKTYTLKDKTTREYISADLFNPFEGEDFEVELSPKWKSDKGIFDYKAKKLLQTRSSFEITGYLTPITFYSKRKKRETTVIGVFVKNPFFGGDIEFRISNDEQYSVLAFYCSEAWNIKLSRYYDEETPVSDDSEE